MSYIIDWERMRDRLRIADPLDTAKLDARHALLMCEEFLTLRARCEELERAEVGLRAHVRELDAEYLSECSRTSALESALRKDDAILRTVLGWSYRMPAAVRRGIEAALSVAGNILPASKEKP